MTQSQRARRDNISRPHYINAIDKIRDAIIEYLEDQGLSENREVSEDFIDYIDTVATEAVQEFKVSERSGLYAWATTRNTVTDRIRKKQERTRKETDRLTAEDIRLLLEGKTRLICVSISDPFIIKKPCHYPDAKSADKKKAEIPGQALHSNSLR